MTADLSTIQARQLQTEADWWRVRQLLIDTYPITPLDFNWEIRRWDGKRYHRANPEIRPEWRDSVRLWETPQGELVGAAHSEGTGEAFLEIHPDVRVELEAEMVAWAEENLTAANGESRQLEFFVYEYDALRIRLLAGRGYEKTDDGGVIRRMRLGRRAVPEVRLAEGYCLRTTRTDDPDDCQRMADLLNAAFNRSKHRADDYHTFMTQSPSFCEDLNLVAEAPDGTLAAHVGVTHDKANRLGIFEPVCTHPDHRRHGLAQSLMLEGLRRLAALGVQEVTVGTGDMLPANALYDSMGFTEVYKGFVWRKRW